MLCSITLIAALLPFCGAEPPVAVGYVEGDYVTVAPIEVARIERVAVRRGDAVEAGALLVELDSRDTAIELARAEAALARARSQLADLRTGARPEEVAVAEAEVTSAAAALEKAEREFDRTRDLFARRVASEAQLDAAQAEVRIARARLAEARARLAVLRLPARDDQIAAAEAQVAEARATVEAARWRHAQRRLAAPVAGTVADVYRFEGDLAGPQAPALSILPEDGVKLRFYVPEPAYARLSIGQELPVRCDGCPEELTATLGYLATEPEFTPPVIYSVDTRQKLVYLAEAQPGPSAKQLKPGQIVDVLLPDAPE